MGIRKSVMFLTLFVVSGAAMASVDIVCTPTGPNEVTVSFTTSGETELVRMISLDVQVNDPCVFIADVNCISEGYNIYPGSISIDAGGNVVDYGTCAGLIDGNDMTSEQGSLYIGVENSPAEGDLFIVTLGGCTWEWDDDVSVTVSENGLRGGVVMENPDVDPTVNLSGCTVNVGECERCPCMGDVDGNLTVNFSDLIAIYTEMVTQYPTGDPIPAYAICFWPQCPYFECADFDETGCIEFGDLITMYSEMVVQYPTGDPTFVYDIGCPFP